MEARRWQDRGVSSCRALPCPAPTNSLPSYFLRVLSVAKGSTVGRSLPRCPGEPPRAGAGSAGGCSLPSEAPARLPASEPAVGAAPSQPGRMDTHTHQWGSDKDGATPERIELPFTTRRQRSE